MASCSSYLILVHKGQSSSNKQQYKIAIENTKIKSTTIV